LQALQAGPEDLRQLREDTIPKLQQELQLLQQRAAASEAENVELQREV
jgi:hypothetical protein